MSQNPLNPQHPDNADYLQNSAPQHGEGNQNPEQFRHNVQAATGNGAPYNQQNGQPVQGGVAPAGHQPFDDQHQFEGAQHGSHAPYGDQQPKKKKTGLLIGLLVGLLLLLALLALALWFFLGRGDKVKGMDEFKLAMDKSVSDTSADKCNTISDTILKESMEEDLKKNNVDPSNVYLCSDVDFTSMEALMSAATTQEAEPKMVMGVYTGDQKAESDNNLLKELENEGFNDGWALRGDNWGIVGDADDSVKNKLLDELGGEEIKK